MKINKLKAISIVFCCLVVSLWSGAQGTDNRNDILESVTVNRTAIQPVSQSEINDLSFESTPSQIINLRDSETSWASYLPSPVKSTMQVANEFVNLVITNPKLAAIAGILYMAPIIAATCECYCRDGGPCKRYSTTVDARDCLLRCTLSNHHFCECLPKGLESNGTVNQL